MFRIVGRLYRQPAPSALLLVGIYGFFALALSGLLPSQRRLSITNAWRQRPFESTRSHRSVQPANRSATTTDTTEGTATT